MNWNQLFGGALIGLAFGIMIGAAYGPGSPEKVSTGTAGFCTLLAIAGSAGIQRGRIRHPSETLSPKQ